MRVRAALWTAALAFGSALLVAPVAAQQPRDPGEQAAKDAKDALRSAGKAVQGAGQEVKKDLKGAAKEIEKGLKDIRDSLRQTREERRTAQRRELRDKWGTLLAKPKVQEELRTHARRMARLDYMEQLAGDAKKDKVEDHVEKVRDREKDRHNRRMDALKAKGGEE